MGLYDPGEFPTEVPTPTVEAPSLDFTVADVLAWARTKPADEKYPYDDPNNCGLCIFLRDTLRAKHPGVAPHLSRTCPGYWHDSFAGERYPYPAEMESALEDPILCNWTFGGLVKRLEALQS